MPHIHTKPNEHDLTVSFYIVKLGGSEPSLLVHMHRKLGKLMQLGGHVELLENPWQAAAHELVEESGFELSQLKVLQPFRVLPIVHGAVVHPFPAVTLTFKNSEEHFHTDLSYAFVTDHFPSVAPLEGESKDFRWMSLADYKKALDAGEGINDVHDIYSYVINELLVSWHQISPESFRLQSPDHLAFAEKGHSK